MSVAASMTAVRRSLNVPIAVAFIPASSPHVVDAVTQAAESTGLVSHRGHDLVGEGRDLVLPAFLQRPLDGSDQDRSLGDLRQSLGFQELIHDRDDPLPAILLFLGRKLAGLLVRPWRTLGGQDRVSGSRLQTDLAQE